MGVRILSDRIAQLTAHRACHSAEHDPPNGKIHGYCIVCGVPWPCTFAGAPTPEESKAETCHRLQIWVTASADYSPKDIERMVFKALTGSRSCIDGDADVEYCEVVEARR